VLYVIFLLICGDKMTLALALLALGEISLCLELGNRLLGSGVRTPAMALVKMCIIVFAFFLLAMPVYFMFIGSESALGRTIVYTWSLAGLVILLHFLFPYRFEISRIRQSCLVQCDNTVISNVVLHDECVSVESLAAGPDGLRFLVVSDLHCNKREKLDLIKSAFAKLAGETFDAAFVLGDLSENSGILPELMGTLANLPNRHGIFLVRGNHDFLSGRQIVIGDLAKRHSIKILSNTWSDIPGLGIRLVGLEYPPGQIQLPSKSECSMTLGLTHTPDNIILFSRLGVDIVVAGHTHGGWFTLPVVGTVLVPTKLGRFINKGWFRRGRTLMYITSGLPYFTRKRGRAGEILRLTIKPAKTKEGLAQAENPTGSGRDFYVAKDAKNR